MGQRVLRTSPRWSVRGSACEFAGGVVEDEVFEMDEFAVGPQGAQASTEWDGSIQPPPTGEWASRSSRRFKGFRLRRPEGCPGRSASSSSGSINYLY